MSRVALGIAALLLGRVASADIHAEYALSGEGCMPEQRVVEIQGTRMRIDMGGAAGNVSAIVDGTEALLWSLDHDQRTVLQAEIDPDAVDFQSDVGKALATRTDRELDKVEAMQRDAEAQMAAHCAREKLTGSGCPGMPAMPNLREMLSPENMASLQQAMAGAGPDGTIQIDPAQMQAMMGGGTIDPALQSQMQAMMGGEDMQKMQKQILTTRAKEEGVDVATLQARDAEAQQQRRVSALKSQTRRYEVGPDQVADMACVRYQLKRAGEVVGSECRAAWNALKLDARDAKGSERTLRIVEQYGKAFAPVQEVFGAEPDPIDEIGNNVVLEQICFEHGREVGRATVRIDRSPITEERFEVPAGYKPPY